MLEMDTVEIGTIHVRIIPPTNRVEITVMNTNQYGYAVLNQEELVKLRDYLNEVII